MSNIEIEHGQLQINKRHEHGPFDIIGDVHGCFDELQDLLLKLGYQVQKSDDKYQLKHPQQRKLIFVGDLVDRGPKTPEVLHLVMDAVTSEVAYCVKGNHDDKLKRKLEGRNVKISHGLAESLVQLEKIPIKLKEKFQSFLSELPSHYVFDDAKLAVAHAGLKQEYIGRVSPRIYAFCLYGETTNEVDKDGLPLRHPWAREYRGKTMIVYGHTPVCEPEWLNNTINIDTGCVFGGKLTALRYPECILVSVDAAKVYYTPKKPLDQEAQE